MKIKKQDNGADAEGVLSFDLVLTLHPRAENTDGKKTEPADRVTKIVVTPGGPISVSTLQPEQRQLLDLVDGQRTVADVVRLSGLPSAAAQKQLRALHDRGVLVASPRVISALDASGPPGPEETDSGAPSDGSSALTRAIDEYLELAASGLSGPTEVTTDAGVVTASPTAAAGGTVTVLPGMVPDGLGAAATAGTPAAAMTADSDSAANKAAIEAMSARFSQSGQAFRPNVTAFWIPSMGEIPPHLAALSKELATAPPGNGVTSEAPARASEAPTVVVKGSPASGGVAAPAAKADGQVGGASSPVGEGVPSSGIGHAALSAPIPFRVGNYEVATRIAQGGMGSIYVCRRAGDAGFQRLFTLKVVRQHSAKREEAVRSFKREAQVGSLLSHPNLQTVLDTGSYKDQPFLVLDYVEGTSLSELVAEDRRAPVPVAVAVLLDVLRGLEHAHQLVDEKGTRLGLVHGDVSPQNVLVGVDGAARLTDFGSATFTGEGRAHDPKWIATGKPAFMAPEQLRAEPLDARTDVFALGIMMWSVLTGQKLFAGDSYDETIIKVLRKKIPPPSSFGAPAYLDDVCLKALSRSREGRYTSAEEMARDLARVASRENVLGTPADVGQWVRRESGEALGEQRRRIQFMFGGGKVAAGRPDLVGVPARPADAATSGRAGAPTIVLDAVHRNLNVPHASHAPHAPHAAAHSPQTPQLGATKTLSARTVFLPSLQRRPAKTFWSTWNVVIVSALLALPVTLTIGYFVSNLFVSHPRAAPAPGPAPAAVNAADAAASQ